MANDTTNAPTHIDPLSTDDLVPIGTLAKRLPGRVHPSTLHRWRRQGFEAIRIGKIVYSTESHLRHFLHQRNAAMLHDDRDLPDDRVEPSEADLDAIEAQCTAAGI